MLDVNTTIQIIPCGACFTTEVALKNLCSMLYIHMVLQISHCCKGLSTAVTVGFVGVMLELGMVF